MGTAVLGAGPAGLTAAYVLARRGRRGDRLRGRRHRRRHRQDRRVRRLPLRPRRPPLLHEARSRSSGSGRRCSARSSSTRPRLSRIYYGGKFFAYPLQAPRTSSRGLGLVESARCALLVLLAPRGAARARAADVRGLGRRRASGGGSTTRSSAPTPRRSGASRARRSAPSGPRSGSRTSRFWQALLGDPRACAATHVDDPDRGVPLPAARARADVGGVRAHASRSAASRSPRPPRASAIHHDERPRRQRRRRRTDGRRRASTPSTRVLSSIAAPRARSSRLDPPAPARGARRPPSGCATATSASSRSMIDEDEPFPDNWIYLHDPGTAPAGSRTSAPGAPTWCSPGTTCLGVEYFCFEGDEIWDDARRGRGRARHRASSRAIGLARPATRSSTASRSACRRPTRCTTPTTARRSPTIRGVPRRLREPADLRPQRPAPLQQPGPLDVDGDARDAQPHRRRRPRRLVGEHEAEYHEEGPLAEGLARPRPGRLRGSRAQPGPKNTNPSRPALIELETRGWAAIVSCAPRTSGQSTSVKGDDGALGQVREHGLEVLDRRLLLVLGVDEHPVQRGA